MGKGKSGWAVNPVFFRDAGGAVLARMRNGAMPSPGVGPGLAGNTNTMYDAQL